MEQYLRNMEAALKNRQTVMNIEHVEAAKATASSYQNHFR
jgi:hypothetical protein